MNLVIIYKYCFLISHWNWVKPFYIYKKKHKSSGIERKEKGKKGIGGGWKRNEPVFSRAGLKSWAIKFAFPSSKDSSGRAMIPEIASLRTNNEASYILHL